MLTEHFSSKFNLWYLLVFSIVLRCLLLWCTPLASLCKSFVAFATPISSWKRYEEGIFLYLQGIDPYRNSIFHQSPLFLPTFSLFPSFLYPYFFMLFDAISAYFLAKILDLQFTIEPTGEKIEKETPPRFSFSGNWIAFIYLFNPMVITSCLSMELGVFERMWVLSAIYSSMTGDLVLSSLFLSLATQFGTYPLFLFPFIAMIVRKTNKMSALSSIPTIFILVVVWHVLFHLYFQQILGLDSLEVLKKTFWATMTVPVITPNLGIFWYFFLELFLPFRSFFLLVFQFHILVYIVPILLRFGKELPLFSTGLYLGILATLKSYPTVGDHALWITFIFLYPDTWRYYRYKFITFGLYLAIFLFIPIMYTLWIHFESGNSNFFYGINLLTLLASVLLLSDYATGVLLRSLYREKNNLESNGEEALLLYSATG